MVKHFEIGLKEEQQKINQREFKNISDLKKVKA